jgi:hypothetical protein
MVEMSFPIEQVLQGMNGHVEPNQSPRVDPTRGLFITSTGEEIELSGKQINSLVLDRLVNEGRPHIPMVEVTLLGKHKQLEANPNDAGYKALLAEWENDQRIKVLRYLFVVGVKGQPTAEFVAEQAAFFPNATEMELKYLWVASRIPDADIDAFSEALMGQARPTEKGIAEAGESFRSEEQRPTDNGI